MWSTYTGLFLITRAIVLSETLGPVSDVGCYSTTFALSANYHTLIKPLTWEICVHLCTNSMTRYVGVQASTHLCYCGNDILRNSDVTNDTLCSSCHEDTTKGCGGAETMSLYQLTESDPEALLIATDEGIKFVVNKTLFTWSLDALAQNADAVGYHYTKNEIVFISKNKILRSAYVSCLMKYSSPITVVEGAHNLSDVVVDWVNDQMYWSCKEEQTIKTAKLDGSQARKVVWDITDVSEVAIDPYKKLMFYVKMKKLLQMYTESTLDITPDILKKFRITSLVDVAVDFHHELIYFIGSYDGDQFRSLACTDYSTKIFRIIYSGPELSNPYSLDVFYNNLVWINYNQSYFLYRGKISISGHLENLTVVHQNSKKISKVKIYHPEAQTRNASHLCMKKACSHSCIALSLSIVRCECPREMILGADGRMCRVPTTTTTPTTTITTTVPADQQSIFFREESTQELSVNANTSFSTEVLSSSTDQSTTIITSLKVTTFVTQEVTKPPLVVELQNETLNRRMSSLKPYLAFVFDMVIICLLLILIYFGLTFLNQIRNNSRVCKNRPSELEELAYNIN